MADGMGAPAPEQAPAQGGGAAESVAGLMEATQFLKDRIVEAPGVPDDMKQAVAQATDQYVQVISQAIGGGAGTPQQGGAQQMETVPGGQPVTPAGV
jgi:hypothetical protein